MPFDPDLARMAHCDAQHIGFVADHCDPEHADAQHTDAEHLNP